MPPGEKTPTKLTDEQCEQIAARYIAGETQRDLAKAFGVCRQTVGATIQRLGAKRAKPDKASPRDMIEFAQRARSILWRQDKAKEKPTYNSWKTRVEALESKDGGGLTRNQAVVRASKEFPCLNRLFREYNVVDHDPNPDSHPAVQHWGKPATAATPTFCEGKEQSYRESLRWAIESAGTYLRTGVQPASCPCDAAWYLYRQAVDEPKDFLAKLGQIESKVDLEAQGKSNIRKESGRSIAEIDSFLEELAQSEDSDDD